MLRLQDSPVPALAIDTTTGGSIALLSGTWQRWDAPSETSSHSIAKRVIDTSALTGVPSFGVITYVYDGGSESGATITTLTILHPSGTGFAPIASFKLGENAWSLATEDRSKYINRISPRFDVELSPVIENATLVLRVQRDVISKELRGRCNPKFEAPVNAPCQRAAMKAIAGSYRLHAGAFERVAAPRVKAGRRSPRP